MQFTSPNIKIIIAVLVLAILGYFGYKIFFSATAPGADMTSAGVSSESQTAAQDILDAVDKFQRIAIDPAVFSSGLFQSLRDFSLPLTPEQQGRANPFAPIGTGGSFTPPAKFSAGQGSFGGSASSSPVSGKQNEI